IRREPAQRYATALALADDLDRFLDGRPIQARRTTAPERLWRWCRRNKGMAAASAIALLLLVAVTLVSAVGFLQVPRANGRVRTALSREADERRAAEKTSKLALQALDRIFAEFTISQGGMIGSVALPDADSESSSDHPWVSLPVEPVLSTEVARALEQM